MSIALLRRSRAGDEGPGRLRPQGHRPRPQPVARSSYDGGILICAENSSSTLRKISEIYDRIAFAGVGKYNEFDQLRVAGVRHADMKGYAYSREDVDARSLANAYAQMLGQIFTHEMKPMEVEILVAEVGDEPADDELFHILYDGSVVDEDPVLGPRRRGRRDRGPSRGVLSRRHESRARRSGRPSPRWPGRDRQISGPELEVAVLARGNGRRKFARIEGDDLAALVGGSSETS